jgi:phosphoglucomutase
MISYDGRYNSQQFAKATAEVLASCGITVFITKELQPTPFLSFAVRYTRCDLGVMITASHNSYEYNGYKLFDENGTQFIDTAKISEYIDQVDIFNVQSQNFENLVELGKIKFVCDSVVDEYLKQIKQIRPDSNKNSSSALKIVYTPLCGAGYKLVPRLLKEQGFDNLQLVLEQSMIDSNFTTCPNPNPEKVEALSLAMNLAKTTNADLIIATDPDCDRVGVMVLHENQYKVISGNEMGVLLTDFLLSQHIANNTMPKNPMIVRNIVSTALVDKIAKDYDVVVESVLIGFKHIGQVVNELQQTQRQDSFILGFEESMGYLIGTHARDKDALITSLTIAEMASLWKIQGLTLIDRLHSLYKKYGHYSHTLLSYKFDGANGVKKMACIMDRLREIKTDWFGKFKLRQFIDYKKSEKYSANILQFKLQDDMTVIIRPSGTEPIIKVYLNIFGSTQVNESIQNLKLEVDKIML